MAKTVWHYSPLIIMRGSCSGCKYSIAKDKEFNESRKVLNGKATELRNSGYECAVAWPPLHDCNPNIPATPLCATSTVPVSTTSASVLHSLESHKQAVNLHGVKYLL